MPVVGHVGDHGHERVQIIRCAPRNAHTQLHEDRRLDDALFLELLGKPQVTRVERLDFHAHIEVSHHLAHCPKHARRIGHDVVSLGKIHRSAVERAYLGQTLGDMLDALFSAGHVCAILDQRQGRFRRTHDQVAAHAGREVDNHIGIGITNPFRHLAVQIDTA